MLLFFEVVNAGSINQASIALDVPKATISRKLRRLESELKAVLLKRGARKLSMTESGESLYVHCERILEEARSARAAVSESQSQLSGRLRIASAFGLGAWIHPALASFAQENPQVELIVDETHRWIDVSEEPYDIAIHLGRIRNEGLPVRRFANLERGLYASPDYLANRGAPEAPADLLTHSCIALRQQLDDGLWRFRPPGGTKEVSVRPRACVSDLLIARALAIAGVGLAILPHSICRKEVQERRLVPLLEHLKIAPLVPAATYLERRYVPLRIRAMLDKIAVQFQRPLV